MTNEEIKARLGNIISTTEATMDGDEEIPA